MEHRDISGAHVHEPKGIDIAAADQVYVANGAGSGVWTTLPGLLKSSAFPVGSISTYAGTTAPPGWSFCFGQELNRSEYLALFTIIGTLYGVGNGINTFNLPDCRGRVVAGMNENTGRITGAVNGNTIGSAGGLSTTPLTTSHIPSMSAETSTAGAHTHTLTNGTLVIRNVGGTDMPISGSGGNMGTSTISLASTGAHTHTLSLNAGSPNTPHNNIQPTIILNTIIYHGVFNG